ncbi:MAG: hypothetical protein ACE5H5_04330, partial [Nitrospinota bacterium]
MMERRAKALVLGLALGAFLFPGSGRAATRPLTVVVDGLVEQLAARFSPAVGTVVETNPDGTLVVQFATGPSPAPDQELFLYRSGEEVINKLTGERLGRLEQVIGLVKVLGVDRGLGRARLLEIKPGVAVKAGDVIKYSSRLDAVLEPTKLLVAFPAGSQHVDDLLTLSLERSGRFRPTVMSAKALKSEVWKERRYAFLV